MRFNRSVISIWLVLVTVLQTTVPCAANLCTRRDRTTICRGRIANGRYGTNTPHRVYEFHLHREDRSQRLPACPFCSGNVVISKRVDLDRGRRCHLDTPRGGLTSTGRLLMRDGLAEPLPTSTDRIASDNVALTGRLLV